MAFTACSDFIHGLLIEKHQGKGTARILLSSALFFDVSLLFFFGYADFFIETANIVLRTNIEKTGYPLPVGITVYTLQTMSYVIDVYHGRQKAARNLLEYASFITMFPQLSAGPIVSYRDMEEPLRSRRMNLHQISKGAKRICVGLAKKVLIADVAGRLWEEVMTRQSSEMSVAMAWLGILAFAFRIYFSFSGYADMAIGLGNCMGFSLPENFDHPYIATSVTDFFRRWNMTLIKWMRTYFFKPLAGERKSLLWQIFMVFVTWGLIGLWYGPDWTFVLWGFWLALFYILEKLFLGKLLEYFPSILRWAYAMLVVAIGLLLLALDDVADAWAYLQVAFGVGARGLWNYEFGALLLQYLPTMVLGVYFSMPLADAAIKKLEQGKNGMSIAITRFLEKVYPGLLLLISLVYLVGRGW
jgi:alginate O-acetyltransferase complex protein AlgI